MYEARLSRFGKPQLVVKHESPTKNIFLQTTFVNMRSCCSFQIPIVPGVRQRSWLSSTIDTLKFLVRTF